MTPLQKLGAWFAGVLLGLIALVTVVDLIRGTLSPAVFLGIVVPTFGGIATGVITGVFVAAKKDKDEH